MTNSGISPVKPIPFQAALRHKLGKSRQYKRNMPLASAGHSFLMERLWFKLRKQPRPALLHEVPELVAHQLGVNIRPFDKAADARQQLWRKIVVSTHGGR